MAWVSKWKKVKSGRPKARLIIITPNCLRVDKAIIFLISDSAIAAIPAIINVQVAENKSAGQKKGLKDKKGKNRTNKKTPAVTSVEECTKAETGVGAAIAAGSQLENGNWALFVIAARVKRRTM